jgi:transposase
VSDGQGRAAPPSGLSLYPSLGCAEPPADPRKRTIGRPRALTDRQVAVILEEHARFLAWRAQRQSVKSQRQLARQFGVSQATISLAVRSKGQYKQRSPDERGVDGRHRPETATGRRTRGR